MITSLRIALLLTFAPLAFAAEKSPALKPLFDGKTLAGWTVKGGTATYRVEDGVIVGRTVEGSKNTFLCTTRDYADFEFECEVKCDPALNSGIQIRSHTYARPTPQASNPKKQRETGEVYGYQCEITTAAKGTSGNFWDEGRHTKWHDDFAKKPAAAAAFKDGAWNHYRIVAQGDRIRSWVNGVPCADFRDALDATGFIGLQVHSIAKGTGPFEVRWRNIRVRELKAGELVK
ncbi:MAG: DUF1080 domain-containing protein [Opitutaceae bacterium]|nr:DUF1080 domain-containing protein [Opitutaceae bacterium]